MIDDIEGRAEAVVRQLRIVLDEVHGLICAVSIEGGAAAAELRSSVIRAQAWAKRIAPDRKPITIRNGGSDG